MIIASIDIGTNTVLMLVAECDPELKKIVPIKNIFKIPRIGKGLKPGKPISDEKIDLLIKILVEYKKIAEQFRSEKVIATATNAFRIASNSGEILSYVKEKLGIEINVITGENEAVYSFLGASDGIANDEKTIVIDIGGGSTEIIYGTLENIIFNKSFPVGVVSSTEIMLNHAPTEQEELSALEKYITTIFSELESKNFNIDKAVAIAGTPTTIACIKMKLDSFKEDLIEGSTININELKAIIHELKKLTPEQILLNFKTVVAGREDLILSGSYILLIIMQLLKLDKVYVSTKGIRYGAIINYLNLFR